MDWARHAPTLAPRATDLHKGRAGKVLVVGGSMGMAGAPFLSAYGALRAGAGLVLAGVPQSIQPTVASFRPEVMTTALPLTSSGQLGQQAVNVVLELAPRWHVAVVGPGAGRHPEVAAHLRAISEGLPCPLVLDADGLAAWNERPAGLARREALTVLTPHGGEAERLAPGPLRASAASLKGVSERREELAIGLAKTAAAIVVLKGPETLVTDGERGWVCTTGGPLLATGGTGDVLSGIIAAMLAGVVAGQGSDDSSAPDSEAAFAAVCAAVYVHGRASDQLADHCDRGVLASEFADQLPEAIREIVA